MANRIRWRNLARSSSANRCCSSSSSSSSNSMLRRCRRLSNSRRRTSSNNSRSPRQSDRLFSRTLPSASDLLHHQLPSDLFASPQTSALPYNTSSSLYSMPATSLTPMNEYDSADDGRVIYDQFRHNQPALAYVIAIVAVVSFIALTVSIVQWFTTVTNRIGFPIPTQARFIPTVLRPHSMERAAIGQTHHSFLI